MEILDLPVRSSDGIHTLAGRVYLPEGDIRGIFHMVHGMTEHIARYDSLMRMLASDGWIVCGYDHLGHGHTVKNPSELGFIAPKKGYDFLARDVGIFAEAVRTRYGDHLPYVLMGHSMGSFVVRYATAKRYACPDRLVVMGTGGPNPAAGIGLVLIRLIGGLRGVRYISPMVDKLAFGSYNARFADEDDPQAWLTPRQDVREAYRADPLCSFKFTVSAMGDLIYLVKATNKRKWFSAMPADLPVLLVSGAEDPVGDNGKGVRAVEARLQKAGIPVTCHLYEDMRHELIHHLDEITLMADLRAFLSDIHSQNKNHKEISS